MELFFLWLWLALPSIFWTGLTGLIDGTVFSVFYGLRWSDDNKALDFCDWYRHHPYTIYKDEEKRAAYEKYLSGKAPKGTPNPYKKWMKICLCMLFCWLMFMPSQKNVAILVGASYAMDMAKSPEGAKVQTLLRSKVNEYLDNEIKAINSEKK